MLNKFKNCQAFTLIELLIVMAVIAILVGIALPRFKGMQDEANVAKANGELRTLKTAIESYVMHNSGTYPVTKTTPCVTYLNGASPLIVNDVLYDPFGATATTEYNYICAGSYYVIFSVGPDGAADITGISAAGVLAGADDDDAYATNGTGF